MHKLNLAIHSALLITTPSLFAYPNYHFVHDISEQKINYSMLSYDEIINLLYELESGELEKKCSLAELDNLNQFLAKLALEGILDEDSPEALALKDDIHQLLGNPYALCLNDEYTLTPAILDAYNSNDLILCKSWFSKTWKQTKTFVKEHKKEIIIGAIIVVAVTVTIVAIVAASSAGTAAGVAGIAGAASSNSEPTSEPSQDRIYDTSPLKPAINQEISSFKETLKKEEFFKSPSDQSLSWEETGRVLSPLFAHQNFDHLKDIYPLSSPLNQHPIEIGHNEIDKKFSSNYAPLFTNPLQEINFNANSYQMLGEKASTLGYYNDATENLSKAIELNPTNPTPYLARGIAHFNLGQYDHALEDYKQFTSQVQSNPLSISDFSLGFAKGLPKGIWESGRGFLRFVSDATMHPIRTVEQMYEAFKILNHLARSGEWKTLREVLVPEVHQLINEWDTLPSNKLGELAGYAFGKYGTDIIAPTALLKALSKGVKGAQELNAVYKSLQRAEQTFFLESASSLESTAKIAEVVQLEKRISEWLGEGAKFIKNEAEDPIFLSKDGLRCVRFDFNSVHPHNNPHAHVEIKIDGKWIKSGQIYPIDVPHN